MHHWFILHLVAFHYSRHILIFVGELVDVLRQWLILFLRYFIEVLLYFLEKWVNFLRFLKIRFSVKAAWISKSYNFGKIHCFYLLLKILQDRPQVLQDRSIKVLIKCWNSRVFWILTFVLIPKLQDFGLTNQA